MLKPAAMGEEQQRTQPGWHVPGMHRALRFWAGSEDRRHGPSATKTRTRAGLKREDREFGWGLVFVCGGSIVIWLFLHAAVRVLG